MNKTVLILIINILFILNCIKSNNTFIINKNAEEYDLSQYLQIYIDNSLKLNYEDILTTSEHIKFINTKTENLSYGFKNAAFWLKFSILNKTDQPQNLIFGIFNSDINFIDFYENSNDSTIKKFFTGESRKFKDRDINHRYYLFNLKLEPGQSSTYYIRAYNNGDSMYLPLKFYQFNSYFQKDYINLIIIGFIFGLFLFIIIYNFFLFITINDKIYLFYSLYALFLSLFVFNIEGLSYQLFL
ncbi:MAG: hypothetical protein KA792_02860, partial [Bacteroidales bacterium]|nr:hypothetical protein [Bacteroidales bacterium]